MSDDKEANLLVGRVDALMRRQQEDSQRAVQEVPLLTEVVEPDKALTDESKKAEAALADDIERILLVRLMPELNKQIAALRGELEKGLRKAVRDAVVEAILAARKVRPGKR